jgi:hypothetical protein
MLRDRNSDLYDTIMTTTGWLTMATVLATVWGGFLSLLVLALRRERGKAE